MNAKRIRFLALLSISLVFLLAWAFPVVWSVLNSLKTDRDALAYPPKLLLLANTVRPIATFCSAPAQSCRT